MIVTGETKELREKPVPLPLNPTCTYQGVNPILCDERLMIYLLSLETA
jgi:hypothetical protein